MTFTNKKFARRAAQISFLAVIVLGWAAGTGRAQQSTPGSQTQTSAKIASSTATSYEIDVPATKQWVDTNIDLHAGEKIRLTTTETIIIRPANPQNPRTAKR